MAFEWQDLKSHLMQNAAQASAHSWERYIVIAKYD